LPVKHLNATPYFRAVCGVLTLKSAGNAGNHKNITNGWVELLGAHVGCPAGRRLPSYFLD
jgi:hypothetical protein